jgi:5-methylcytosine-specific restriction endonuclease McrA
MAQGVKKGKIKLTKEEIKAKKREYLEEYYSRPEVKSYRSTRAKKYNARPEIKARKEKLAQRPERKAQRKEYNSKPETKARERAYNTSAIGKARFKKSRDKPENKAKRKARELKLKLEVFSVYSKRHSNSDIPICRCCGYKNFQWLQVDHIGARKHLSEKEKLLGGKDVWRRLKKDGYPSDFQILCPACNFAKSDLKECPIDHSLD